MDGFSTPDQRIARSGPPVVKKQRGDHVSAVKPLFLELDISSFKTPTKKRKAESASIHPNPKKATHGRIPLLFI